MRERLVIRDGADLLIATERAIASALAPIVAELGGAYARFRIADEIEERDLIPRATVTDQPTAAELFDAILAVLEEHASRPGATVTGAHDLVRRLGRSLGVVGAASTPAFRRTRAEVDDDPNPGRRREGTQGLVGGVLRGDVGGRT